MFNKNTILKKLDEKVEAKEQELSQLIGESKLVQKEGKVESELDDVKRDILILKDMKAHAESLDEPKSVGHVLDTFWVNKIKAREEGEIANLTEHKKDEKSILGIIDDHEVNRDTESAKNSDFEDDLSDDSMDTDNSTNGNNTPSSSSSSDMEPLNTPNSSDEDQDFDPPSFMDID